MYLLPEQQEHPLRGVPPIAFPQYQARIEYLHDRYNRARSQEHISMEGILDVDEAGSPYLDWEFKSVQPIHLEFEPDLTWRKLVNQSVKVDGYRKFKYDFKRNRFSKSGGFYFLVDNIIPYTSDFESKLKQRPPSIAGLDDYLNYYPYSEENPYSAFILNLVGLNGIEKTGLGLTTYISEKLGAKPFLEIKNAFQDINPTVRGRYSDALYITSSSVKDVVTRNRNEREIDFLIGNTPGKADFALDALVTKGSEMITFLGEGGLEVPYFDKQDKELVKYALFYANVCSRPKFNEDALRAVEESKVRIIRKLNDKLSFESPVVNEIIGSRLNNMALSWAKANNITNIQARDITKVEDLQVSLLEGTLTADKDFLNSLIEREKKIEQQKKEIGIDEDEGLRQNPRAQNVWLRIRVSFEIHGPLFEEELLEKLSDLDKKLVSKILAQMKMSGHLFTKSDGRLYPSSKI